MIILSNIKTESYEIGCQYRDWTYKESVKCTCWTLGGEVKDISDLHFRVSI